MKGGLILSVAVVANILVVVICTDITSDVSRAKNKQETFITRLKICIREKGCSKNEEFSSCPQSLQRAQYCSVQGQSLKYLQFARTPCKKACVCKENYLRDNNGNCIPVEQCSTTCGPNEVLDNCPVDCQLDYCPTSDKDTEACPTPQVCPPPACKCAFNYRRAINGSCIPTIDCPRFSCKARPNEKYVPCPPICPTDACGQPRLTGVCPFRIGIRLSCNPKCQCKDDFARLNGTCVPFGQCPNLCPTNEEYSPCVEGTCRPQNCSQRDDDSVACSANNTASCTRGCVCKKNFYRNNTGVCVSYEQCDAQLICGENENLVNCSSTCTSDYCPRSEDEKQVCVQSNPCQPACKCKFNYRRAKNGTCIPTTSCPPFSCKARPNEKYVPCPLICPTDACGQPRLTGVCPFRIGIRLNCNPKCQCKDDYARLNGTCIPLGQCPNLCPTYEEYSPCVEGTCRPQNCSQRDDDSVACSANNTASCTRGCVCKKNFYRNNTGVCVSYEQCDAQLICGENENLVNCSSTCTSDYCPQSEDEKQVCVQSNPCQPACKCRFNYRRAKNGTCIPTTSCPPFSCKARPHEKYVSCPSLCPTDACGQPRLTGVCPFRIGIILNCNPKCQCKDDYARLNGTCVPFGQCPNLCPTNEEYSPCVEGTCRPQNCSQRDDDSVACSANNTASCTRGCVCKKNFYRNNTGVCVSYEQCEGSLCKNANEVYSNNSKPCPPNTCASLVEKFNCDKKQKEEPGCICRSGYLRLKENSTCVPTSKCPEMTNSSDSE